MDGWLGLDWLLTGATRAVSPFHATTCDQLCLHARRQRLPLRFSVPSRGGRAGTGVRAARQLVPATKARRDGARVYRLLFIQSFCTTPPPVYICQSDRLPALPSFLTSRFLLLRAVAIHGRTDGGMA